MAAPEEGETVRGWFDRAVAARFDYIHMPHRTSGSAMRTCRAGAGVRNFCWPLGRGLPRHEPVRHQGAGAIWASE